MTRLCFIKRMLLLLNCTLFLKLIAQMLWQKTKKKNGPHPLYGDRRAFTVVLNTCVLPASCWTAERLWQQVGGYWSASEHWTDPLSPPDCCHGPLLLESRSSQVFKWHSESRPVAYRERCPCEFCGSKAFWMATCLVLKRHIRLPAQVSRVHTNPSLNL